MTKNLFLSFCIVVLLAGLHVVSGEFVGGSLEPSVLVSSQRLGRKLENRIVGGSIAGAKRYPYYTFLNIYTSRGGIMGCGGTLIAPDVVLTAAHCVYGGNGTIKVFVNRTSLNEKTGYEYIRTSNFYLVHPNNDPSSFIDNDIALVFLDNPVTGVPLVQMNRNQSIPFAGQSLTAMGLGFTKTNPVTFAKYLMKTSINVVTFNDCVKKYGNSPPIVNDYTFCAGGQLTGPCIGDSGGPLVRKGATAGRDVQMGIISFGPISDCVVTGLPGGFTRVSFYSKWIDSNVCRFSKRKPSTCNSATPTSKLPTRKPTVKPTTRKPSVKPVI